MKRETITLDARAQWRLYVLNHILTGEVSAAAAAGQLGLSIRSVRRLLARYRGPDGVAALIHGNAGRIPANRLDPAVRVRIVELASTTYCGVNRTHLAELLSEREAIVVAARTVRRIAGEAGLPPVRRRRARGHRVRRERMSSAGLLLQVDGSRHDWLEGRGPMLTLVGGIDDATGVVTGAVFRDQEDAAGYLEVLIQTATRYGLPVGLYSDRHGIFWKSAGSIPTLAEQFAGRRSTTQLGRALELAGIAWIAARSPQAKGRVERLWGTLQDRLRTELRLAGVASREAANVVLADYLARHNTRFAVPPADPKPSWRPPHRPAETLFCFRHPRRLGSDGTFVLGGRSLRPDGPAKGLRRSRPIVVEEHLDGNLWVELDGARYRVVDAPPRPATLRTTTLQPTPPAEDHPWRRYPAVRPR
jgi:transposase